MRAHFAGAVAILGAALAFSSLAAAQAPQAQQETGEHWLWKYNGRDRVVGTGGPAPARNLSGTWSGPLSGSGVPGLPTPEMPSFTPEGEKLFSLNHPIGKYSPAGTNDRTSEPVIRLDSHAPP